MELTTYLLLTAWGSWLLVWLPTLLSDILVTSVSSLCSSVSLNVLQCPSVFLSVQCVISAELRVSRRLVQLCLSRPRPAPPGPQPHTPGQAGAEAGLGCVICFAL